MARHVGRVHTFSIGFEDAGLDELPHARMVAKRYGTVHHEEYVTGSVAQLLPTLMRHYGEPFADSSAIPTYCVSRLARNHVSMVLSGDGGDELFGGYDRYRWFRSWLRPRKKPLWKRAGRGALGFALPQRFPPHAPPGDAKSFDWPSFMPCIQPDVRRHLAKQELADADGSPIDAFTDASANIADGADPRAAQWMDFHTYLPGDVLTKVDIASMMTGLEVRTPLLDLEVARFAVGLPMQWGIGDGGSDKYAGKKVLRSLLAREMGEPFATRRKAGFTVPLRKWFAAGSELDALFHDTVLAGDARIGGWLKPRSVRELHDRHLAGDDQSTPLWAVLVLETWIRQVAA
jgi:asparagine synthase (glutamine-hydrolysing)